MRHQVAGSALSRSTAPRMLMLRGAVTDLLRNGRIKTTQAKAKEIRRLAEKTISRGKKGTLHQRRQASASDRTGGYTRLTKIGHRQGDAAQMAVLELVE